MKGSQTLGAIAQRDKTESWPDLSDNSWTKGARNASPGGDQLEMLTDNRQCG